MANNVLAPVPRSGHAITPLQDGVLLRGISQRGGKSLPCRGWRRGSQVMHTVTDDPSKAVNSADVLLPAGAQPWDSGAIDPERTYSHTFDVPGTYKYFCQPHEAAGMVGTIVVTP